MLTKRSFAGTTALALLTALPALAQPAPPPTHTAIALDPAAAERFSGYYQVGPGRAVRYWLEDGHFYFGAMGTPQKTEMFPETPTQFFFPGNPLVTFSFNAGADGKSVSLTLHQGGRDIVMPRIEESVAKSFPAPGARPAAAPVARTWKVATLTPRNLTSENGDAVDYWPCFSPDGKTVLFSRSPDGGKSWTLLTVPSAGGAAKPFAALSGTRASWSKGGMVVFNGGNGVWTANGDGGDAHAVAVKGAPAAGYPSWYPDGKSIGFGDAASNILYRMDIASGALTAVTDQKQVLAGMSSVSPDGKAVIFAGQKNSGQVYNQGDNQIWLAEDGHARPVETAPGPGRTPSWSPDGKRIAFESDRGSPDGHYAIFIINRDGSNLVQVTNYALNGNHPVFSPDGKRLVFSVGSEPGKPNGIAVADLPD